MNEIKSSVNEKFFEDEISINELFNKFLNKVRNLLKYKKWISAIFIISLILGFIFFKIQTINYKAEINFVLDDDKQNGMNGAGIVASQLGLDIGSNSNGVFSGDNLIFLFKSRLIIEKTLLSNVKINNIDMCLADYYLQTFYSKNYKNNIFYSKKIENLKIEEIKLLQSIRYEILKDILEVKQKDKKTTITSITVVSKNELFSKLFCEQIAKDVSNFYIETRSKKAKLNRDVLQKQVDSVRNKLNQAIDGVAIASDKVYNLNPAYLISKTSSTKRNVDIQANTAVLTQLVANLEMAKITLRKETPLIQIIDYPILPLDQVKFSLVLIELIFTLIAFLILILYFTLIKK